MKQIIVIHGGSVYPNDDAFYKALELKEYNPFKEKKDWKDGLFMQLKEKYQVIKPTMPNSLNAKYRAWKIRFEKIFPYVNDEDLILIGHSLGGIFLLKYLGENSFPKKIKQLHLVSAVVDEDHMNKKEKCLGDFNFDHKIIPKIENQAEEIYIYHSTDDPVVPYNNAEKIKAYLPNAKLITLTDRGHFNQPEFLELLNNIRD